MMVIPVRDAIAALKRYRQMWYWLYALKLATALVITIPALIIVQADVDYSSYARPLLGEWSLDVLSELIITRDNVLTTGITILAVFSILVFLFRQFLNGGIYRTIWNRQPLSKEQFFGWAALHFGDHLRISLVMFPVYMILFVAGLALASFTAFLTRHIAGGVPLAGSVTRLVTIYVIMTIGVIFSDVIRLRKSARPDEQVRKSVKEAFNFYRKHAVQLLGVYLAFLGPFVLLWLATEGLAILITGGMQNSVGVVLELVLFQFCAFMRTGQGLLGIAGLAAVIRGETQTIAIPAHYEATVD